MTHGRPSRHRPAQPVRVLANAVLIDLAGQSQRSTFGSGERVGQVGFQPASAGNVAITDFNDSNAVGLDAHAMFQIPRAIHGEPDVRHALDLDVVDRH